MRSWLSHKALLADGGTSLIRELPAPVPGSTADYDVFMHEYCRSEIYQQLDYTFIAPSALWSELSQSGLTIDSVQYLVDDSVELVAGDWGFSRDDVETLTGQRAMLLLHQERLTTSSDAHRLRQSAVAPRQGHASGRHRVRNPSCFASVRPRRRTRGTSSRRPRAHPTASWRWPGWRH